MHAGPTTSLRREYLVTAVAAVAVGLFFWLAPVVYVPCDFIAFWSSAVLFVGGFNPYDAELLLPLQFDAGFRHGYAITIFNPPWALTVIAPLGCLPVRAAFAVWVGVQFALVSVAGGWLWRASGGSSGGAWRGSLLAVTFAPTLVLLTGGQLTGLPLFGLAGYLHARTSGRPRLAGCLGALAAVKPHLLVLFALALVIDALRSRDGRKVVFTGGGVVLGLAATAAAASPHVFEDYAAALAMRTEGVARGMAEYPSPVLGVILRDALPGRPGAVAYLPLAFGAAAFLALARRLPTGDQSAGVLPLLVVASLVIAPYGGWWYDQVLLLPLVLLVAVRLGEAGSVGAARAALLALAAFDLVLLLMYSRRAALTPVFALVPPVVTLGCLALLRATRPASDLHSPVLLGAAR